MSLFTEERAFTTPEKAIEKAKHLENDKKAVMTALKMEKDTLIFYYELKDFIPYTHKKKIEDIINEERMHVTDLTALKNMVK